MQNLTIVILICVLCSEYIDAKESTTVRRYALITAANDGGAGRITLRYAVTDALAMAKVFQELGGLDNSDRSLLLEPSPDDMVEAIQQLKDRIAKTKQFNQRSEILFYYSGHSDEKGLLLGNRSLPYKRLRNLLSEIDADVKLAILDSCASGVLTRIKGGKKRPAFLVDASTKVSGHAFLTSSSANENAQESDAIGGSYFTHYLVSALRGAADVSSDRRVTLNEAYQFAFHETLARTELSLSGAQHAAYDIQLAGAGDLVLTDLNKTNATLRIPKNVTGRLYIRDMAGRLVVELNQNQDRSLDIGLDATKYSLTLDSGKVVYQSSVTLSKEKPTTIQMSQFQPVDKEPGIARGGTVLSAPDNDEKYLEIPVRLGLLPHFSVPIKNREDKPELVKVDVNLLLGRTPKVDGMAAGVFMTYAEDDVEGLQGSTFFNITRGNMDGIQGAAIGNLGFGNVEGIQGSAVANMVFGDFDGIQGSAITNIIRKNLSGVQGTGIVNFVEGNIDGAQMAGIANINQGNLDGIQAAGIVNVNYGDIDGVQAAAIMNIANGQVDGGQFSALVNVARKIKTVGQVSLVNVARQSEGMQIGLINVSKKHQGLQIGVINTTEELKGQMIGLINIFKHGRFHVGLGIDDMQYRHLYLKTGTRSVHNILSFALRSYSDGDDFRASWGIGTHFRWNKNHQMDLELLLSSQIRTTSTCVNCDKKNTMLSLRALERFQLRPRFSLVAGLSLNVMLSQAPESNKDLSLWHKYSLKNNNRDHSTTIWPGFFVGLEI